MKFGGFSVIAVGLFIAMYGGLTEVYKFGDYVATCAIISVVAGFTIGSAYLTEAIENPRDNTNYVKFRNIVGVLTGLILLGVTAAFILSVWDGHSPISIEAR